MKTWLATKTLITLGDDGSVADALALMKNHRVHHLLIVDLQERPIGLFSERSLTSAMTIRQSVDLYSAPAIEYSNREFIAINKETTLGECLQRLQETKDTCALVLDGSWAVGIVTESDLVAMLAVLVRDEKRFPLVMKGGAVMADSPLLQSLASLLSSAGI